MALGNFPDSDVALVKLKTDIKFGDLVQPIAITEKYDDTSIEVIISGWGRTIYLEDSLPDNLQYAHLQTMSNELCKELLNNINLTIWDTNICTSTRKGKGGCYGDGGSPIVAGKEQVGIVSGVVYACAKGYPDYDARVSSFARKIKDIIGK